MLALWGVLFVMDEKLDCHWDVFWAGSWITTLIDVFTTAF